ncbi:hypothetical protein L226DRAFT_147562 [Lentinus tigrinus ALCF2SS1-7]|uniref:Uncharacterized protein n=1 Tax=Lentinus tigrinus ALCF2SS1-6 TaxID=1328759 RepID=A0A5C2S653_9APHY|nr:hypothetical protein L227DRAFT_576944 [Lentinus tigrinus ALCF2SS1-6]RPD72804.1 hypothetical protein L226DRAFT_147562 [Lentinus tigrinus ALCF2SS1-7]
MVSAYIRIAHKYQMDTILNQWLGYLKKHFTSRFKQWISHERMVPEGFDPIHAIGVVNLARLTGCTSILPTAIAVCTTLGEKIVTGFTRNDGIHEQLSMADLGRCFQAKGHLIQANATAIAVALEPEIVTENCSSDECSEQIRLFVENGRSIFAADYLAPEGLVPPWSNYEASLAEGYDVCCHCLEMMRDDYKNNQRVIWRRLPEITGVQVDGWNL